MAAGGNSSLVKECAGCKGPLDSCLVLICDHRLCLACAAQRLCWPPSGRPAAQCPCCGRVTDVDPEAARHLQGMRKPLPAVPAQPTAVPVPVQVQSAVVPRAAQTVGTCPPVLLEMCGQCQAAAATIRCQECGEQFCNQCSDSIHARGRMATHSLFALSGERVLKATTTSELAPVVGTPPRITSLTPRTATSVLPVYSARSPCSTSPCSAGPHSLVPGARQQPWPCPNHPEEPIQFFCMDCYECICAECAVHGTHTGHDVLNVNKAHQQLTGKISEVMSTSQARLDEIAGDAQTLERLRQEISITMTHGRRKVQEVLEHLNAILARKEGEVLAASQSWEKRTDEVLEKVTAPARERAQELQEVQGLFRQCSSEVGGNELEGIKSLNVYATARERAEPLMLSMNGLEGGALSQLLAEATNELGGLYTQDADFFEGLHRLSQVVGASA
mmetsp:Transcript_75398/g.140650  ORF Transcript_75398/g.140650 Transcript_75398/m.140650 type:complete len:446 (+) Transcript_75398:114-1451(+)